MGMLFTTILKKNYKKEIKVFLKNGQIITGTLLSCDSFLVLKLENASISDSDNKILQKYKTMIVKGGGIKYFILTKNKELEDNILKASRIRYETYKNIKI